MTTFTIQSIFNLIRGSSPLILYLILLIFVRMTLEKLHFLKRSSFEGTFPLIKGILHFFIILISTVFALGMFGIDIQGIIAGLGLFSFAVGFALKDAISNFIAGLSILIYKPFKVGDFITIDGCSGRVGRMDIRYTLIEAEEELYLIPNSYIIGTKIVIKRHSNSI